MLTTDLCEVWCVWAQRQNQSTVCIQTHTPWQNAQAALNHNTLYWSRLNSHKASLKEEIGQIRNRLVWEKLGRETSRDSREECDGNVCSPVFLTCNLLPACATVHFVFIYMILIYPLLLIVSYSPPQSLSLCLSHTFSVILPQQQISCWRRLQAAGAGLSGPGIDPAPSRGLPFISEP